MSQTLQSPLTTQTNSAVGATSPLSGAAERNALATLLSYMQPQSPFDQSQVPGDGTPAGPTASGIGGLGRGAPSTGSVMGDIAGFGRNAGQAALGMVANPASIPGSVLGTMAAAGIRAAAGIPSPTNLSSALGLRGALTAAQEAMFGLDKPTALSRAEALQAQQRAQDIVSMFGEQSGYGDKPGAMSQQEVAAQLAEAMAMNDMGPSKSSTEGTGVGAAESQGGFASSMAGSAGGGVSGGDTNGTNLKGGGLVALAGGGKVAYGPGGGLDDLIPTTIDGRTAAALSDGEFVIPADVVSMMGDGSSNEGSRRLYDFVKMIRQDKTGTAQQAGPLPVGDILKRVLS